MDYPINQRPRPTGLSSPLVPKTVMMTMKLRQLAKKGFGSGNSARNSIALANIQIKIVLLLTSILVIILLGTVFLKATVNNLQDASETDDQKVPAPLIRRNCKPAEVRVAIQNLIQEQKIMTFKEEQTNYIKLPIPATIHAYTLTNLNNWSIVNVTASPERKYEIVLVFLSQPDTINEVKIVVEIPSIGNITASGKSRDLEMSVELRYDNEKSWLYAYDAHIVRIIPLDFSVIPDIEISVLENVAKLSVTTSTDDIALNVIETITMHALTKILEMLPSRKWMTSKSCFKY